MSAARANKNFFFHISRPLELRFLLRIITHPAILCVIFHLCSVTFIYLFVVMKMKDPDFAFSVHFTAELSDWLRQQSALWSPGGNAVG